VVGSLAAAFTGAGRGGLPCGLEGRLPGAFGGVPGDEGGVPGGFLSFTALTCFRPQTMS